VEKKQRIVEIIRSLDLPDTGEAVDFGCGNGVLTDVVRQALPVGWTVYGANISKNAVNNARKRYPKCEFMVADDPSFTARKFDFLFTHHVREHVCDIVQVLNEMDSHLKDHAAVLHILPCGNAGSFEYNICQLRADGINPKLENRFFFEDEGHVRRPTTEQLSASHTDLEFHLTKDYYSHQYYVVINWITQSGRQFVQMITGPSSALDEDARKTLLQLRRKLLTIWALPYPAHAIGSRLHARIRSIRQLVFLIAALPLYALTKPMDYWIKHKAERGGSEMYLFFTRDCRS
jgi:trans-aconitate methyltransferase